MQSQHNTTKIPGMNNPKLLRAQLQHKKKKKSQEPMF